ncbi:MAG TPA: CBS domain-containing protein [Pirellulaceae bacterium]|nr:CBS domain-containing protein [Pirellulaceae bacterium]HMO90827.1 CBS domain-containing protein [Pirellulaceae bacterium]HMP68078.1 CBS domain-containing protein [Pirellulaceae bacterium]
MRAKDFMSSHFVTVPVDSTMDKAVLRFLSEGAELLLVTNSQQNVIGIISEADLLAVAVDSHRRNDPVSLYTKRHFVSVQESAPLEAVLDQFILHRVRCIPVISQHQVIGLIHRREVIRLIESGVGPAHIGML